MPISTAMMPITTRSSTSVKASGFGAREGVDRVRVAPFVLFERNIVPPRESETASPSREVAPQSALACAAINNGEGHANRRGSSRRYGAVTSGLRNPPNHHRRVQSGTGKRRLHPLLPRRRISHHQPHLQS